MTVSPEETAAHVRARIAFERERDRASAEEAMLVAQRLATVLVRDHGARRVVLFGSLATGRFGPGSDIDLAVEGLAPGTVIDVGVALEPLAGRFQLDLVRLEALPDGFRARVERDGMTLG